MLKKRNFMMPRCEVMGRVQALTRLEDESEDQLRRPEHGRSVAQVGGILGWGVRIEVGDFLVQVGDFLVQSLERCEDLVDIHGFGQVACCIWQGGALLSPFLGARFLHGLDLFQEFGIPSFQPFIGPGQARLNQDGETPRDHGDIARAELPPTSRQVLL